MEKHHKGKIDSSNQIKLLIDFFSGGIAGSLAKTLSAPLERVKLLLQLQQNIDKLEGKKFTGIWDCLTRTVKEEGVLSLWRGNWPNIVRYFPLQALNFSIKGFLNRKFNKFDSKTNPYKFTMMNILSGGVAGATAQFIVFPLDFARTRMAADIGKNKEQRTFNGSFDCLCKIFKKEGVKGIYRGYSVSFFSGFAYRALYFGLYDSAKKFVFGDSEKSNFFMRWFFAQIICNFSETLTYPFDTVRRRLMLQGGREKQHYTGVLDCFSQIYKAEGFNGFFKGNLSNITRSVGSSLVLVLYDEVQRIMKMKEKKNI